MAAAQEQEDIVQQEILQVALRLYQKFGPDKVTMDDVATATGRSRSSLYYYYKNRDDIYQAVLDTVAKDVAAKIRKAVGGATALNDKFYAFGISKLKTSEDWKSIFNAMWQAMDAGAKTRQASTMDVLHQKLVREESAILKEIIAASESEDGMRNVGMEEQEVLAFIMYSGIRGIRNEVMGKHSPQDMKTAMRLLADMAAKWLKE